MIKLFFSNYGDRLSEEHFFNYLSLLPEEIKNRVLRFRKWEDRQAGLYGKLLLKKGLEELELDSVLADLKYTQYGRPYLDHKPDFNISHSTDYVVCAISTIGRIGVDIEKIRAIPVNDFREQFSDEEWKMITASNDNYFWFYYYWTAKEAVIKAEGKGLNIPLKNITMQNSKTKIEHRAWHIKRIDFDSNYLLQIASDKFLPEKIDITEISF